MWKLMKLEWKKNNMKKYVGKAAVVTVIIFLMIFATSGELNEVETVEIYGKSMIVPAWICSRIWRLCFVLPLCCHP